MDSFIWNDNYETGVEAVDNQHYQLVSILNRLGEEIYRKIPSSQAIQRILEELASYTVYHFETEERLMREVNIADSHFDEHFIQHQQFVEEVGRSISELGSRKSELSPKELYVFLVQWLIYHILGTDKQMGRQINAIQSGVDPKTAEKEAHKEVDEAVEPLVYALNKMVNFVCTQNNKLVMLNKSLDEKVSQRTKELQLANEKLIKVNEELEWLSHTDELTELFNRRYALAELRRMWSRKMQISCLIADLDNFKHVNDSFGHEAGDDLLIQAARFISDRFSASDIVARLGGDEFLVICPDADLPSVLKKAELLCAISAQEFKGQTLSIGVATKTDNTSTQKDLLKFADNSLYLAKREGRNCVRSIQAHE